MLYDPKWKQQPKADPYSLASLIAWLEKQPADAPYWWSSARDCLLGQWLRSTGMAGERTIGEKSMELDKQKPFGAIALNAPYTFGAALERARAAVQ